MQFGSPELFKGKVDVRLAGIERAIAQFRLSSEALIERHKIFVGENDVLYIKGFGNEINLLSAFRELYFNSRELLDYTLGRISAGTKLTGSQSPKDFLPFFNLLVNGDLDKHNFDTITFLKKHANYIFHIRKIRNLIKNDPSVIEFVYMTNGFIARMKIPIAANEVKLFPALNVVNQEAALANNCYFSTMELNTEFPETLNFWRELLRILGDDGL